MKAIKVLLFSAWILALQLNAVHAQTFSVKTHKFTVKGTSSLHDWQSNVEKIEAKGSFVFANNNLIDVRDVAVKIPVKAIKSPKGKLMDSKTWDAFNYEKYPSITFLLTGRKINADKNTLEASGSLTMAGVTKAIELSLAYKVLPGGELQITGTKKIVMSEFKMEPPTAMMGTIKVGDEVEVDFELVLNANNSL
jgi:polyisoprenoid-binding protein YceI